jgi:DNA-binding transcriptional ArsR family regulator
MGLRWIDSLDCVRTRNTFEKETIFQILRNRRRRYVLHYLKQRQQTVPVGRLAEQVAAWENETELEAVTPQERKRVYISLLQSHLPTLEEANMIAFEEDESTVRLTDDAEEIDIYVELVPENDIQWPEYYLGLSLFSGLFLVAVWQDVPPLTQAPDIVWLGFVLGLFVLSSVVYHVHSKRQRLGTEGPPPE